VSSGRVNDGSLLSPDACDVMAIWWRRPRSWLVTGTTIRRRGALVRSSVGQPVTCRRAPRGQFADVVGPRGRVGLQARLVVPHALPEPGVPPSPT
jgi:hypothetical protein